MGSTGRHDSCDLVNLSCSSLTSSKRENLCNSRKEELCRARAGSSRKKSIRCRVHEMGSICRERKKTVAIYPASEERKDDCDFSKHFGMERWPDDDDCMWLSSGTMSPSSCLIDSRLSSFLEQSLDRRLVSFLSISPHPKNLWAKEFTFLDGSKVSPLEEATLVLQKPLSNGEMSLEEDSKEEEVVTGLVTSMSNDFADSAIVCSEFADVCYSSSSLSTENLGFPNKPDTDGAGLLISLINIDVQDSKWTSDTGTELDYFLSDFPSPSCKSSLDFGIQFSNPSSSSLTEVEPEKLQCSSTSDYMSAVDGSEDFSSGIPLFWPSDGKCEWGSEAKWDFFIMSPRKTGNGVGSFDASPPESMKLDPDRWCKRRLPLVFGQGPESTRILELKRASGNKLVRRLDTMPSRLSKSINIRRPNVEDDVAGPKEDDVFTNKSRGEFQIQLEEENSLDEIRSIETQLGLNEFDGHEGVDSEFNRDDFSLHEFFEHTDLGT